VGRKWPSVGVLAAQVGRQHRDPALMVDPRMLCLLRQLRRARSGQQLGAKQEGDRSRSQPPTPAPVGARGLHRRPVSRQRPGSGHGGRRASASQVRRPDGCNATPGQGGISISTCARFDSPGSVRIERRPGRHRRRAADPRRALWSGSTQGCRDARREWRTRPSADCKHRRGSANPCAGALCYHRSGLSVPSVARVLCASPCAGVKPPRNKKPCRVPDTITGTVQSRAMPVGCQIHQAERFVNCSHPLRDTHFNP